MLIDYEKNLWQKGISLIAGVDEVGRGCLAGPMVVGAVILNPEHLYINRNFPSESGNNDVPSQLLELYESIKDSKKLTPKKRKELSIFIIKNAISYQIETISNTDLDSWGISKATQVGFFNSVNRLSQKPQHILTDSFKIKVMSDSIQTNIVHGDNLSISVAAASIIAKVFRDELMVNLHNNHKEYQKYCFDQHKGYGTKQHIEAINKYGICDLHRRSFEPIKSMLNVLTK
jgi:ribonuclease HII